MGMFRFPYILFDRVDSEITAYLSGQKVVDFTVPRNCETPVAALVAPP